MSDEEMKARQSRAAFLADWVAKLRLMLLLPDDFLRFVLSIEHEPTDANFAKAEQFIRDTTSLLQKRAQQASQPSQPEQFVQGRQYLN